MREHDKWMRMSYEEATLSPDPSTQNGALLVSGATLIGWGHNDFPHGISEEFWDNGNKEDKYARVCHAEVSAILDAARRGHVTDCATLICGWAACANCAKYIARAGVSTLIRHSFEQNIGTTANYWYQDCVVGDEILTAAGVKIVEIEPVSWSGALRRNGDLWKP